MRRKGKAPRDHARDNIRAMRAQQAHNRAVRDEAKSQQPGFKMKRFQNVKARVDRSGVSASPTHAHTPPPPLRTSHPRYPSWVWSSLHPPHLHPPPSPRTLAQRLRRSLG